jgi:D-alanine--poly(phosphoribitol) ligase subunit 2
LKETGVNDNNAIIERLGTLFAETFHIEVPAPDTDLLESGVLDSFQFVELLFQLEQKFDVRVRIDDLDLDDLRTIERIARLVAANGKAAGVTAADDRARH